MNPLTLSLGTLVVVAFATPSYAELIAYEGFDYAEVGEQLWGKTGGVGFAGEWRPVPNQWGNLAVSDSYQVAEGSLSYGGLLSTGNRIWSDRVSPLGLLGRALDNPIQTEEPRTIYYSYLVRPKQNPNGWFGSALAGGNVSVNSGRTVYAGATAGEFVIENFSGTLSHSSGVAW